MNKPHTPIVNFLLAGVQKSATTTLHSYLGEHPEIQMSVRKEIHFFNNDNLFKSGDPDYSYYHSFFNDDKNDKKLAPPQLLGEATPAYIYCRDAPKRIWQYNPNMKIIVILRNPIERAYSHWNMEVSRGADTLSFEEALRQEPRRCREALPAQHYVYSYIDRGFYTTQLRELWRFFKKEQTLILKYEQLKTEPESVLRKVFHFLGVNIKHANELTLEKKILHKTNYKSAMSNEAKAFLINQYTHEIHQLEDLLDTPYSDWLE